MAGGTRLAPATGTAAAASAAVDVAVVELDPARQSLGQDLLRRQEGDPQVAGSGRLAEAGAVDRAPAGALQQAHAVVEVGGPRRQLLEPREQVHRPGPAEAPHPLHAPE